MENENVETRVDPIKIVLPVIDMLKEEQSKTTDIIAMNNGIIRKIPLTYFIGKDIVRLGKGLTKLDGQHFQFASEEMVSKVFDYGKILCIDDVISETQIDKPDDIICINKNNIVAVNMKYIMDNGPERINDNALKCLGEYYQCISDEIMKKVCPDVKLDQLNVKVNEMMKSTIKEKKVKKEDEESNTDSSMDSDILSDGFDDESSIEEKGKIYYEENTNDPREILKIEDGKDEEQAENSVDK